MPIGTKETAGLPPVERSATIAIYHYSIKIISRGKGKSAVAAAAYRAGEKILNEYDGMEHDYTRKGGVVHTEILLPANAPSEYKDRAVLWNAVEKIEKAKNSQLARELEIALPKELSLLQNRVLVRDYVKRHFIEQGMCADIAIHDTGGVNPHAHIMLTMRPFNEDRTWGDKQKKEYIFDKDGNKIYDTKKRQYKCKSIPTTDWNEQSKAEEWRAAWAETANRYLEKLNHSERIDHRSYERQGIDQVPTIHLSAAASQMEKRGIRTERGNINREIEVTNQKLRQLKARLAKLQTWLKKEMQNTEPPMLADAIQNILNRQQGYYNSTSGLKQAANILNFLTANHIKDMADLDEYFKSMIFKREALGKKLKPIERRLDTLDKHIDQSEKYQQYRPYMAKYDELYAEDKTIKKAGGFGAERKAKKALDTANQYYEAHRMEITLCQAAEQYIKGVLNGRDKIPLPTWKAEREKLIVERKQLDMEYKQLKSDTTAVEKIRSNVYDIVSVERSRTEPQRTQGMEL